MFEFSDSHVKANEIQSSAAAACSIVACTTVLSLSAWIWSIPSARYCLDRLSFRLLLHALACEIVYDIAYLVVVVPGITGRQPAGVCATGVYFMMAGMGVVNYLVASIAVNLAITIVLGLNPIRLKLERYYIGFSLFIGLFVPIIPGALGHFGWDPVLDVCWIKANNDKTRIRNMVLDLYLWQLLSCVIALAAVIPTLIALFRQGRATSRALLSSDSMNITMLTDDSEEDGRPAPKRNVFQRILHRRRQSRENARTFGHLEDRFVRIAIRIAAYPVALFIVNGVISIGDLYISATGGVKSRAEYGLYIVYYFLYGARGCVFVALCVFVDPCLRNGLREAWAVKFPKKEPPTDNGSLDKEGAPVTANGAGFRAPFTTMNDPHEKSMMRDSVAVPEGGNMDFMTALFALDDAPEEGPTKEWDRNAGAETPLSAKGWRSRIFSRRGTHVETPPSRQGSGRGSGRGTSGNMSGAASPNAPGYSDAFAGVPLGALPEGLGDGAEDVVQREVLDEAKAVAQLERALAASSGAGRGDSVGGTSGINVMGHLQLVDKLQRRLERATPSSSRQLTPIQSRDTASPVRLEFRRPSVVSHTGAGTLRTDPRRPSFASMSVGGRTRSRTSEQLAIRSPRTIEDERRLRRDRAFELAERLYEELESQL